MLYHIEKGIPEEVKKQMPKAVIELHYSRHAQEARINDRYGEVPEFKTIDPNNAQVVEAETDGWKLKKVVYRIPYTETLDCCIVVLTGINLVKTVWVNRKSDNHKTLDLSKYN